MENTNALIDRYGFRKEQRLLTKASPEPVYGKSVYSKAVVHVFLCLEERSEDIHIIYALDPRQRLRRPFPQPLPAPKAIAPQSNKPALWKTLNLVRPVSDLRLRAWSGFLGKRVHEIFLDPLCSRCPFIDFKIVLTKAPPGLTYISLNGMRV